MIMSLSVSKIFSKQEPKHLNPYQDHLNSQLIFSVVSTWWLLNQESTHVGVCDMEHFYATLILFFESLGPSMKPSI